MPAVSIPVPDQHGIYRYPDGSGFRYDPRVRKFCAWWARGATGTVGRGGLLRGDNDEQSWFDTKEDAAQAIADGGEGPAAPKSLGR